ncbi:FCD domain-containing protein [Muricoccus aerilatus]|uniref:FCD domain-containing protein n=1 Tax=Muricoccus aerilatus TaxID=452982 RepID=UPI0009FF621D|nr:FCD domain-containing protein [Roseomonas aerilata]
MRRGASISWLGEPVQEVDRESHRALIAACGLKLLLRAHAAIYDRYLRYQIVAVVFRGEAAAAEHRRLLDSALARDGATGGQALAEHLRNCVQHVVDTGALARFGGEAWRVPAEAAPRAPARPIRDAKSRATARSRTRAWPGRSRRRLSAPHLGVVAP